MPILDANTLEFISRNPDQTRRLGARLGAMLPGGSIVALEGELGSGKTVLAQGIGQGWGALDPLLSPTFILIRRHQRAHDRQQLYHIDLYRLESPLEIEDLGLEEILGAPEAITIVEWSDRHPDFFPPERLQIQLRWLDEYRRALTCFAHGPQHQALLDEFRKEIVGH